ncbi:MAG: hypothetical protein GXY44_07150 [Phycisphaerales bacterium]|nr:hypothetical protein [Phycisphaerales bacterium]
MGLVILAGIGCHGSGPTAGVFDVPVDGAELPIIWEKTGIYSRINRPIRLVIHDEAALAQVPIAEVQVDFRTHMLLIAGMGPVLRDDVGIRITRLWREGTRIRVQEQHVYSEAAGPEGIQPASPWTIIAVPRSSLNVEGYSARVPKGLLSDHPGSR